MSTPVPAKPKIYHIVHLDRLPSIVGNGALWCDAVVAQRAPSGTIIGMSRIKQRRLHELTLANHPTLHVGDCVPFYFCPRSVMLYLLHQANHPDLRYRGGQEPILHLEADLLLTVAWANANHRRWAFTLSNAGAYYFEDRCSLTQLNEIDWVAVAATDWRQCKEAKQAEFLVERDLPWHLVSRIGVFSQQYKVAAEKVIGASWHNPPVVVRPKWYY